MHKYKVPFIPVGEKTRVYVEGKQDFAKGKHRGYNPYAANNLALAVIWWNGWDTAEEEREAYQKSQRQ